MSRENSPVIDITGEITFDQLVGHHVRLILLHQLLVERQLLLPAGALTVSLKALFKNGISAPANESPSTISFCRWPYLYFADKNILFTLFTRTIRFCPTQIINPIIHLHCLGMHIYMLLAAFGNHFRRQRLQRNPVSHSVKRMRNRFKPDISADIVPMCILFEIQTIRKIILASKIGSFKLTNTALVCF